MSIWVDNHSKLVVQGITGSAARYHTEQMIKYGTNIVAGVTPGKKGQVVQGVPVFDTVKEAVIETGANTSIIYVPAPFAADAIMEAVDAETELVVCITEHIPVKDMLMVKAYMAGKNTRLIGPNCPGIITPGQTKIGIMPGHIHVPGNIGIISRSGTLTYEAVGAVTKAGLGQSTAVGIGGDPIHGADFIDVLKAFNEDKDTHAVILIGEIGGDDEEVASEWIKENMTKPVVAFISGRTAPKGKRMGHAGAIVSGSSGTAESKIEALKAADVGVADKFSELVPCLMEKLNK
ncbi:MAG TPA: succinate--CoA ligase subunit alpha [Anaerovoracaceae bacterium]|nr:succinate--CoA ligase subunit alpha [Anaerovoracaceae bacterium]